MHKNTLIVLLFTLIFSTAAKSQGIAVGAWRDHLPYNDAITLAEAGDKIYCASKSGLFYYSKSETTVDRLSKINGLSDIDFSTINYDIPTNTLVIAYANANIDLIQDNRIINIPDIKRKIIPGNKTINKIFFKDNYAYLACGFGIVVLDLIKKEIKDTYYIGPGGDPINVTDITSDGNEFFASTELGIYHASVNASNLANYNFWSKYNTLPQNSFYNAIEFHNNKIFTNLQKTGHDTLYVFNNNTWAYFDTIIYANVRSIKALHNKMTICGDGFMITYDAGDTIVHNIYQYFGMGDESANPNEGFATETTDIWIADGGKGLVKNTNSFNYSSAYPNGPRFATAFDMSVENSNLWVASGGITSSWNPTFERKGLGSYINGSWNTYYPSDGLGRTVVDIIRVAVNPFTTGKVFAGSWLNGIVEFTDNQQTAMYDTTPPALLTNLTGSDWIRIGGLTFDNDGNLWAASSNVSKAIYVRKANGTWKSFSPPNYTPDRVGNIIIDDYNQKWILLPYGKGLMVFNDNYTIDNTADDKYKTLTTSTGKGHLPSSFIYCLTKDLDGEIWVGTDKGIAVFYSPGEVFTGNNFDAQQILIEQDGYAQYLFETEIVSVIAVDGGNRKWIGTQSAGVFLMSADGTKQLHHFTIDNSPLFSNNILSIAIDHITGEVFIGTEKGIISYKGTATGGGEVFNEVYAYPNPVNHEYDGPIAIKGLIKNADVKITDISGKLVYATKAEGGQAVWNGKNFQGEKAHTGVYLVFASNEDGSQTHVTKILIVN